MSPLDKNARKLEEEKKKAAQKKPSSAGAAIGGAAALIAGSIKSAEVIAFDDLGAEAVRKLYVEDFPVTVVLDAAGGDLYEKGREEYLKSIGK